MPRGYVQRDVRSLAICLRSIILTASEADPWGRHMHGINSELLQDTAWHGSSACEMSREIDGPYYTTWWCWLASISMYQLSKHLISCTDLHPVRVLQSEESRRSGWHNEQSTTVAWLDCPAVSIFSRNERAFCMSRSDMRSKIIFRLQIGLRRSTVGSACHSFSGQHEFVGLSCGQTFEAPPPLQDQSV